MKKLQQTLAFCLVLSLGLFTQTALAQCGTFEDAANGDEGMEAHSLYRDAVKAKDLEGAYDNWLKAYTIAPAANGKNHLHYADGRKILKIKFDKETDEAKKQALIDNIIKLYDEQIACYGDTYKKGQDAYLLGRKGFNMFYYYKNYVGADSDKTIQDILATSVEKAGNNIEDIILVPYASVVVNGFVAEKLDKAEARAVHAKLNEIADHNIANNPKTAERFKAAKASMNGTFATIEGHIFDCDYFVEKVRPTYEANPDDPKVIEESIKQLKRRGCAAGVPLLDELEGKWSKYAAVENAKRQAEFEANNPGVMANKLYKEGNFEQAIVKYQEAIDAETDDSKKAGYYNSIASIQFRKMKKKGVARTNAMKAAKLRPGWGKPYLMIGDMYASSTRSCGKQPWEQRMVVLAAVEKYRYAKSIDSDPNVQEEANSKIGKYASEKPDKGDVFMAGYKPGGSYKIGCWIGETVTIRVK